MKFFTKLTAVLVAGLLMGATVYAQSLSVQQRTQLRQMIANGASSADIAAALTAAGVDMTDATAVSDVVAAVIAEVPPAEVSSVSQAITLAIVTTVANSENATPEQVEAVAQAAASGAATGAVQAAAAADGATSESVAAAAQAASSGAAAGAVTAAAQSTNTAISSSVADIASAAATGASNGATSAASAAAVSNPAISVAAVTTASSQGSSSGAVAGAASTGASVAAVVGAVQGATNTTTQTQTTTEVVDVDTETEVEIEVPNDDVTPQIFTVFTLQLSYGNFSVTTNNLDNVVTVIRLSGTTTVGTVISSNGGTINDLPTLPNVALPNNQSRGLNATQRANLDVALTTAASAANGGTVVVEVPSNNITVSPSS